MAHKLYRTKDRQKRLFVCEADARVHGTDTWLKQGRYMDDGVESELVSFHADVFDALFEHVTWKCGVDLYSITHNYVGKSTAYMIAEQVEARLAALERKEVAVEAQQANGSWVVLISGTPDFCAGYMQALELDSVAGGPYRVTDG